MAKSVRHLPPALTLFPGRRRPNRSSEAELRWSLFKRRLQETIVLYYPTSEHDPEGRAVRFLRATRLKPAAAGAVECTRWLILPNL